MPIVRAAGVYCPYGLTLLALLIFVLAAAFVAPGGLTACAGEQGDTRVGHLRTVRFPATADTHSRSDAPTRNFGRASRLVAERDTSIRRAYLRFNLVLPTDRVVTRATLRLHALSSSGRSGVRLHSIAGTRWKELGLTWRNAPRVGSIVAKATRYSKGRWVSLDATRLVQRGRPVSMALTAASGSRPFAFSSRNGRSRRPSLIVETAPGSRPGWAGDAPGAAPPQAPQPGKVNYMRIMNSDFDTYSSSPTEEQKQWMGDRYWRALVYSPHFDKRTAWFPRGWVYHDAYAIYTDSEEAREHPDWVLRDSDGKPLYIPYDCDGTACTQYAGDFGNPEFRQHVIKEIKAKLDLAAGHGGYKGVFVDDVNMDFRVGDVSGNHVDPIDPRTGAAMTKADWRRYLAEHVELIRATFPTVEIVHNPLWWTLGENDPFVERQAKAADHLNFERGVNDAGLRGGTDKYGFETFLEQADRFNVIFESEVRPPDEAGLEYGLASYFLVNDGKDAVSNHSWRGTPDDWWSAGYDLDLGAPLGPRYSWDGLLRRDFEGGVALVNQPDT
ncbi:MAG TPA: DNRLRE domain-containing protein, partial [Thermoleophilaceae bacterium]|nr:DNRLRE domain-containing protein [Thermoleophilaceae bacterium]